ncbi:SDR family NAD(P)-dependent oxidoreductase [Bifidobacterium psychraerophilum]|uniref:Clavaldehyde dehydrogenase n=1 Tax=Bifidobacterium psychraerophilum TaxID=218140 RepID=A0A087CF72_9BIFI|nr:SDR family NAD(P)-dependent oxidoreductase [Bifidobacterium psychraerophilum]KFI81922.1 Clavaldehyde dehydrogenase [Bifidobacterium psychraerophilum]PKA94727.1 NADP-dependent 3-hydroxy acid dehydrogenase YdfG [Bifidobacterium psychraerophilum DSM 22366]
MVDNLQGTVALITGASSGIGQASARRLAAAGASVAIVARRTERLEELADELRASGSTVLTVSADLTDADAATDAVERTVSKLGRLDTVVNAAGLMLNGPTAELTLDDWDRMIDINLRGLLHVSKVALPHLLAAAQQEPRKVADLVNISSVAGRFAAPGTAGYNATKFGVTAVSEALRQEYAKEHLRVSVVEPGRVDTELFDHREGSAEDFEAMFGKIEPLRASDIAEAVATIVTSPRRSAINEIVIRPTEQF